MDKISLSELKNPENLVLSLQHLLAMYAGAVVVPILIAGAWELDAKQTAYLVAADIVICGLTTLLQIYRGRWVGIGLPVVMASSFTGVGPMIQAGTEFSPGVAFGSVLGAGIVLLALAPLFAKMKRLFPPLVTGIVVMLIGLTLIPVAINNLAGGQGAPDFGASKHLIVGALTFLFILIFYRMTDGFLRSVATLIGLVVGTVFAFFVGLVDLSAVQSASWFQLPVPFALATPSFEWSSVLSLSVVGLVTLVEVTGNYYGLLENGEKLGEEDLRRGYLGAALGYILAGIFNTTPQTAFSQNLGVIKVSGVRKREVIIHLVIWMLLLGLVPKLGVIATAIPSAVLGGAMIFLFGNVLAFGVNSVGGLEQKEHDGMIIAASVAIGMGVTVVPEAFATLPSWLSWLTSSGIVAGTVTAVLLNLFFNGLGAED